MRVIWALSAVGLLASCSSNFAGGEPDAAPDVAQDGTSDGVVIAVQQEASSADATADVSDAATGGDDGGGVDATSDGNVSNDGAARDAPNDGATGPLSVTPGAPQIGILRSLPFTAGQPVTWSVQEGAAGGGIDASGKYVSPATPGTYHVVATSTANPAITQSVTVTVVNLGVTVASGVIGGAGNIDGPPTHAHLRFPQGVGMLTTGAAAGIYVSDTLNHTIRKYDPTKNAVTTLAGKSGVVGTADGVGSAARFNQPWNIATNDNGSKIWVADFNNSCIRSVDPTTGAVTTLSGTCGTSGHADGTAGTALFGNIYALVLGPQKNALYVCDRQQTGSPLFFGLRRVDVATGQTSPILTNVNCGNIAVDYFGNRVIFDRDDGSLVYFSDTTAAGPGSNPAVTVLVNPMPATQTRGIGCLTGYGNENDIYTLGVQSQVIYHYGMAGTAFDTAPYSGSLTQTGTANGPVASARYGFLGTMTTVPPLDLILVPDQIAQNVRKIDAQAGVVTDALGATANVAPVDGPLGTGRLNAPLAIAADPAGNTYVTDIEFGFTGGLANIIRKIDTTGAVTTLSGAAVQASPTTVPMDGTATVATFGVPYGITYASGSLYVVDEYGQAIRTVSTSNGSVKTLAGQLGTPGSSDGVGAAAHFQFYTSTNSNSGGGIATDGTNLYVADSGNYAIRKVVIATGQVTTLAGGTMGTTNGTGKAAQFLNPLGVTFDRGTVYVADQKDDVIRSIDTATGAVTTLVGLSGSQGDVDGDATKATFDGPFGLTADGLGNLYVVEWNNGGAFAAAPGLLRRVDIATRTVSTLAGTAGQSGVATGPLPSTLNCPTGLALTPSGDTLVSDVCDGVVVLLSAL